MYHHVQNALNPIALQTHPFYNRTPGGGIIYICTDSVFLAIPFQTCMSGFYTNPIPPAFVKHTVFLSLLEPPSSPFAGLLGPIPHRVDFLLNEVELSSFHSIYFFVPCSHCLLHSPILGLTPKAQQTLFLTWEPYFFFFNGFYFNAIAD